MRRFAVALCALLAALLPATARAQAGSCELVENRSVTQSMQNGSAVFSVAGPLLVRCSGGAAIRADEANIFQSTSEVHLFGNVSYQDPEKRLTSNNATYASGTGLLHATGDVVYTDLATGSTLRGPVVDYYRPQAGRPVAQVIAQQRPHLSLASQPRPGQPAEEPLEVDADQTTIAGDALSASGSVVIHRSDLDAQSSTAQYNRGTGDLNLRGAARVQGDRFGVSGEVIDARVPETGIEQLIARRDAVLTGEDIRVTAPELQLYFADDLLQRLVGRRADGDSARPLISSRGFRLEADSLEALSPTQRLDQVVAIGAARGETFDTAAVTARGVSAAADSTPGDTARAALPLVAPGEERDWLSGDTITGFFAAADSAAAESVVRSPPPPTAAGDSARADVRLDRLVAQGSARALYRVRDKNAPVAARPALNYLAGQTILLHFADDELAVAQVSGLHRGVYLDPGALPALPATDPQTGTPPPVPSPSGTPPGRQR